ncbi:MAG: hypothetical protein AAB784_01160 [Patescibacteria group bacterium]
MSNNKKFGLIFVFLIFLPVILTLPALVTGSSSFWGIDYGRHESLPFVFGAVALMATVYIFFVNSIKNKRLFWYILSILFFIISIFILYGSYSLSNFGF